MTQGWGVVEKFDEFAQYNIEQNGLGDKIRIQHGDALELMPSFPNNYFNLIYIDGNLIYIDGDKGNYLPLALEAESKLAPGGTIIIDDIFFHGDALNDIPTTEKGAGCKAVLDHYKNTTKFSKYLLPINNGILLLHYMG